MIYFITLLFFVFIIFGISQFVKVSTNQHSIFQFFIQQIVIITACITLFAVFETSGKTIFILFLPFYFYLFKSKSLSIKRPSKEDYSTNLKYLLVFVPIILIQFLLHVDLTTLEAFMPSDDIQLYSSMAHSFKDLHNENGYEVLGKIYPDLFSGIAPYHYYEIWFTAFIGFFSNLSYTLILLLIVYPYLVWIFVLGIVSVFEYYLKKISFKHYLFAFLLLLVGPLYFTFYETLFHDGEFFKTTVFTIIGFVKQTLPFSYYGQKHLPVYIFALLSFLLFVKQHYTLSFITGLFIAVCSFGTFPGIFGAFGLLFLLQKKFRTKQNFIIIALIGGAIFTFITLFKMGINTEISQKTFYFKDFLKYLNLKGEILRVIVKIVDPLIWFSILYLPIILLVWIYRKIIFANYEIKVLIRFIGFAYISGALFISLVQGLNSDQFLTNLLPIFNVIILISLIYIYSNTEKKSVLIYTIAGISVINSVFIVNSHIFFNQKIESKYSVSTIKQVRDLLKQEKSEILIAYVLSDSIVRTSAPTNWYPYKPGKAFMFDNYFNYVNINYPYTEYERNSSSIAFGSANQMRFYLENKKVPAENFGQYQVSFLKKHTIGWLFCAKDVVLTPEVEQLVDKRYYDKISGEMYCKLKD